MAAPLGQPISITRQPSPTPTLDLPSPTATAIDNKPKRISDTPIAANAPQDSSLPPRGDQGLYPASGMEEKSLYPGSGTVEDPYVVGWLPGEKEDPYNWSKSYKWAQTGLTALNTLCIAFASSAYSGAAKQMIVHFHVSKEVFILGISLYVLGFGVGPLLWAPLSEMFGRRIIFVITFGLFTIFNLAGAVANNIQSVLIFRFFAGLFGAAPLTNSGGTIADMWSAQERGLAAALFALAPFLGPVIGPIVGGFAAPSGWRLVFYTCFGFSGALWVISCVFVPETYAPTLLRRKAKNLIKASGGTVHYISKFDAANTKTFGQIMKINMSRPFVLLFKEPIVLLLSIYTAIIYGTLYLFFTAFPIVFQQTRGWSSGVGGLAFLGVGGGMIIGTALSPFNSRYYARAAAKSPTGRAPPEARLLFAMIGSVLLPIGLFWFAWTSNPKVHWIAPILAGVPFGMGMIMVFVSIINYLIDSYLMFAASALAANAVMRSLMGAAFPLFSTQMYDAVGLGWGSSIPGFLAVACMPFPFIFYRYGPKIRAMSKFAPTAPPAPSSAPAQPSSVPAPAAGETAAANGPGTLTEKLDDTDLVREPEWGPEAGMDEQRELERRQTGDRIV